MLCRSRIGCCRCWFAVRLRCTSLVSCSTRALAQASPPGDYRRTLLHLPAACRNAALHVSVLTVILRSFDGCAPSPRSPGGSHTFLLVLTAMPAARATAACQYPQPAFTTLEAEAVVSCVMQAVLTVWRMTRCPLQPPPPQVGATLSTICEYTCRGDASDHGLICMQSRKDSDTLPHATCS